MGEASEREPVTIGDAFPADDLAGQWVVELSMAMNDLTTLDSRVHFALEQERSDSGYYFRLLCGTLRELWRLFKVADEQPAIGELIDNLVPDAKEPYDDVRLLFVRQPATDQYPKPRSWAEEHLKDVRDRTFHYPHAGSEELRDALISAAEERARLIDQPPGDEERRFQYADVVALHAAFGNIDEPEVRAHFEEIVQTSKHIASLLVPVMWNSLGTHLYARHIDPARLRAGDPEG
jgi:hypothetical protein